MPESNRVVRMYQAGNTVWVNFNDLTRYLREFAVTPSEETLLRFPELQNAFRQWTENLLRQLAESEPAWVKEVDLHELEEEQP